MVDPFSGVGIARWGTAQSVCHAWNRRRQLMVNIVPTTEIVPSVSGGLLARGGVYCTRKIHLVAGVNLYSRGDKL